MIVFIVIIDRQQLHSLIYIHIFKKYIQDGYLQFSESLLILSILYGKLYVYTLLMRAVTASQINCKLALNMSQRSPFLHTFDFNLIIIKNYCYYLK